MLNRLEVVKVRQAVAIAQHNKNLNSEAVRAAEHSGQEAKDSYEFMMAEHATETALRGAGHEVCPHLRPVNHRLGRLHRFFESVKVFDNHFVVVSPHTYAGGGYGS